MTTPDLGRRSAIGLVRLARLIAEVTDDKADWESHILLRDRLDPEEDAS